MGVRGDAGKEKASLEAQKQETTWHIQSTPNITLITDCVMGRVFSVVVDQFAVKWKRRRQRERQEPEDRGLWMTLPQQERTIHITCISVSWPEASLLCNAFSWR